MLGRLTYHQGQVLSIVGTAITTAFQGGNAIALEGVADVDVEVLATFDAATTITTMDVQLQVSDDNVNWEPVAITKASTGGVTGPTTSITAAAGTTVRERLQLTQSSVAAIRNARYVRVAAKSTGASKSGDSVSANLNFSEQ